MQRASFNKRKVLTENRIPIRIMSNLRRLGSVEIERFSVVHRFVGQTDSVWGGITLFFQGFHADVVVLDGESTRLLVLCLFRILFPFQRCLLVSLDILLQRPNGWREQVAVLAKRRLLRRVDHFILYFKDLSGYSEFYGISPARSFFYVPFKVNLPKIPKLEEVSAGGEFIVSVGRSHRDIGTFVAAMRQVNYPGILLYQDSAVFCKHGTDLDLENLPNNLQTQSNVDGDGRYEDLIRRARVVVLPIAADCISSAGISSYLVAMAFRRCVIITDGPATHGLLTEEAIVVPPGDARALAQGIRTAWEDDGLREKVAKAGRRYAEQLGGEDRLLRDILNLCGDLVASRVVADLRMHDRGSLP
jgi:glycosyltransferase involved in cell wall biosynthesis